MSERTRTLGAALALCAALVVTMAVTEAEALECSVTKVRITTRTMNYADADVADNGSAVFFYIGNSSSPPWMTSFSLDNVGVEDFKEGAMDEFIKTFSSPYPVFPTSFAKLKIANIHYPNDVWGMAGFKVEIWCNGATQWYPIFVDRGLNMELDYSSSTPPPQTFTTTVGAAGSDSYNGDHEVLWLVNIGDHVDPPLYLQDGVANDLRTCNHGNPDWEAECNVRVRVEDVGNNELLGRELVNSWWDVNSTTWVNPLEMQYGEGYGDDVYVDNFWRWFYTSGNSFSLSNVHHVKLVLDNCDPDVRPCSMQTNYLHATVMQAWGKPTYDPYPYFRSYIYEGDYTSSTGWLEVTDGSANVTTTNKRYYGFSGTNWHVEPWQDSEHPKQQMGPACGYMSADMILSTRGFNYEEISTDGPYADAERWEEAAALAHLEWGYKTMCCGSWNCCADVENCVSDINLDTDTSPDICSSSNYTKWWTYNRCDYTYPDTDTNPNNDKICSEGERFFWRDDTDTDTEIDTSTDTTGERFPYLIDYNGHIVWTCRPGVDDDGDTVSDETDRTEFWSQYTPPDTDTTDAIPATPTKGIRGAVNETIGKFLTHQDTTGNSEWDDESDTACGFDPVSDDLWFGDSISITDALSYGYGMYFGWNHKAGICGGWDTDTTDTDTEVFGSAGGGHYSVIDGFEKIYHPGQTGGGYDYLFFISDPNSPVKTAGTDHGYESIDNIGFSREDFDNTVKGVTIWNYDYYL